jgi:nucleoside-diphosphate-sugar epimerase
MSEVVHGKKIVITGGGGFIGSTVGGLLADENEVILIDQRFAGNAVTFLPDVTQWKMQCKKLDILEETSALQHVMRDADVVIHMAAMLGVQNVIENPRRTLEMNFVGTMNVARAAERMCPRLSRFIFMSTSEIFGGNAFRIEEDGASMLGRVEDARWCYSLSKLAAEHLLFGFYRENRLPVVAIRPFNVFGARRIGDYVIKRFVEQARAGEPITVHGDGAQIRSWCHVMDFADGLIRCISNDAAVGQSFNLGNPRNTVTIYELAQRIVELTKSSSKIVCADAGYTDIDVRVPSIEKARRLLGWHPMIELNDGLFEVVEWYRKLYGETAVVGSER